MKLYPKVFLVHIRFINVTRVTQKGAETLTKAKCPLKKRYFRNVE